MEGIGHIGVFVRHLESTLDGLVRLLGGTKPDIIELPERGIRFALVDVGPVQLEIVQDLSAEGMVGRAVQEHGDHIHHFCLLSDHLEEDMDRLGKGGTQFIADKPWVGIRGKRVIFTKPETTGGIPVELSEP